MKKLLLLLIAVFVSIAIILQWGCKKEDEEDDDPQIVQSQIVLSPTGIVMNDNETAKLFLSVQPPQQFQWNVSAKPDWLVMEPSSGIVNNQIIEITLTVDTEGLNEGLHQGVIEIITGGAGKATSTIEMYAEAHPEIFVSASQIHFNEDEDQKTFIIANTGTGYLTWQLESAVSWLTFSSSNGTLYNGDSLSVTAEVSRNGMDIGTVSGSVTLNSNAESGNVEMAFSMDVPAMSLLTSSSGSLLFDYFIDQQTLTLINEGNIATDWSMEIPVSYIASGITSGTIQKGDSVDIVLDVDRTGLVTGSYNSDITFSYDEDGSLEIPVTLKHYLEEKWLIEGSVIDAEYDRVNDVIIAVSGSPNRLRKFDPQTMTETYVDLNLAATCVSVGPSGDYAAVGHNGKMTYINLTSMTAENIYSVTAEAADIVLASNGWAYVFPMQDQWERIRCIELATGMETEHTGNYIYDNTKAKLHPSGKYIYGADNGLSPSDFEKYDITGGTAVYMYDSPYHGTYAFSGNIWISDNGARLFARSRNVFNSTENPSTDMTYSGALAGEGNVVTLDHHSGISRIYSVFSTGYIWEMVPDSMARIYEAEYLAYLGTVPFPGFLIPDGTGSGSFYNSLGYFGFLNSAGTEYYVLVKAEEGSGALNDWAIATIEVE